MKGSSRWATSSTALLSVVIILLLCGIASQTWIGMKGGAYLVSIQRFVPDVSVHYGLFARSVTFEKDGDGFLVLRALRSVDEVNQEGIEQYRTVSTVSSIFSIIALGAAVFAWALGISSLMSGTRALYATEGIAMIASLATSVFAFAFYGGQRPKSSAWRDYSYSWGFWMFVVGSMLLVPALFFVWKALKADQRERLENWKMYTPPYSNPPQYRPAGTRMAV
jgi:hypothetical protein